MSELQTARGEFPAAFEEEGRTAYRAWCEAQSIRSSWERLDEQTRVSWRAVAAALLRGRL